jgi:EAL domain-containing protein (putative c-di-GMP-specific phosphodiesterase class I)
VEQGLTLRELDCDTLQGYYFSKPVPGANIVALLQRRWAVGTLVLLPEA